LVYARLIVVVDFLQSCLRWGEIRWQGEQGGFQFVAEVSANVFPELFTVPFDVHANGEFLTFQQQASDLGGHSVTSVR
jgi:hypothetical protein